MTRPIFDPRMLGNLGDFFPSVANIQEATETTNDYGEIVQTWGDLVGHTSLPCAVAPTGGQEVKLPDQTYVVANYTISFPSDQSRVTEKMRVVVTGPNAGTYDILLVQVDSRGDMTRMFINEVE